MIHPSRQRSGRQNDRGNATGGRRFQDGKKRRRTNGVGGGDYRWKSSKRGKVATDRELAHHGADQGDHVVRNLENVENVVEPQGNPAADNAKPVSGRNNLEVGSNAFLAKHRMRLDNVKEKKRSRFEEDRKIADRSMRRDPSSFLWNMYKTWAGDKLSSLEQRSEQWSRDCVSTMHSDDTSVEESSKTLISRLKEAFPDLYDRPPADNGGTEPSVCVLLLASSGLRAATLGKSMYDGKPVGKLFSKHIKKEMQHAWLQQHGSPVPAPTAVGTARRVHVLCDSGFLSLACCSTLVIDMDRDLKLRNILDMEATRHELFDFLHQHIRPLLNAKKLRIVLHVSQK